MLLKELEIIGFKSFAEKTRIPFSNDLTSIVGPNGCGKSNILDSVRWVMGDRSLRSLRSEKMEDVIFSGSETKKPLNFARVSLTLNNESRHFSIDTDQIHLSRAFYRDGQGQFFLNQKRSTLKDLENLLMDTGLGKSCYSFMEQGKIDMILSNKPEERRYIFEEAAGISRFKSQQEEARKKLEAAEINVSRVKDIMNKMTDEIKLKNEQAKKAIRYKELNEQLDHYDLRIKYADLLQMDKKLESIHEKTVQKKSIIEKNKQKLLLLHEELRLDKTERDKLMQMVYEQNSLVQIEEEKSQLSIKEVEQIKSRMQHSKAEKERLQSQAENTQKRILKLKGKEAEMSQMRLELQEEIQDKFASQKNLTRRVDAFQTESKQFQKQLEKNDKRQKEIYNLLKNYRLEHKEAVHKLLKTLETLKKKWLKAQGKKQKDKEQFLTNLKQFFKDLESKIKNISVTEYPNHFLEAQTRWKTVIDSLAAPNPEIKRFFLDKTSVLILKEELDTKILSLEKEAEQLLIKNKKNNQNLTEAMSNLSHTSRQMEQIKSDIRLHKNQNESLSSQKNSLHEEMKNAKQNLHYFQSLITKADKTLTDSDAEIKKIYTNTSTSRTKIKKEKEKIEKLKKQLAALEKNRLAADERVYALERKIELLTNERNELEIKTATLKGSKESLLQDIYNRYELDETNLKQELRVSVNSIEKLKEKAASLKTQMQQLGIVNPLAAEELQALQKENQKYKDQLSDVLEAKEDILKLIYDITSESQKKFFETFKIVEENFKETFRKLFGGGNTFLALKDDSNSLESGIEIQVSMPGKRQRGIRLLSGGERTLTAIALMFAIYMVKSSPVCVLDEIDANLDDSNVLKLLDMLQTFSDKTQFILITHNKLTMSKSSALFGVTMEEPGVSKLIQLDLKRTA